MIRLLALPTLKLLEVFEELRSHIFLKEAQAVFSEATPYCLVINKLLSCDCFLPPKILLHTAQVLFYISPLQIEQQQDNLIINNLWLT